MTKISPHLWYTDKADEAAAFYASKVEPGKHIGRLNVRARIDHRDRKPRERWANAAGEFSLVVPSSTQSISNPA